MSVKQKFDEDDRRAVVDWLKKHDSVSILKKPEYRKLFEDTNGRLYLVLGAYDEWHGVPEAILNMETEKLENGVFVIARRYPQSIEIFRSNLVDLAKSKGRFNYMAGKYDFHTQQRSDQMIVEECSSVILDKVGEFSFNASEKATSKKRHEVRKQLDKLSPDEKAELLRQLENEKT